ncbi:hypothetical protein LJC57_02380 [Parabacteroides sp. OttesenSCG-928-G07]|nr:hypothetical protein [Parabacteroides sp. OttesenSCG-928-G07]
MWIIIKDIAPLRGAPNMDILIPRASARGCVQGAAMRLKKSSSLKKAEILSFPLVNWRGYAGRV